MLDQQVTTREERAARWVDEQVKSQNLWNRLQLVKKMIPDPSDAYIRSFVMRGPIIRQTLEDAAAFEQTTTPIDWQNLDRWIQTAKSNLRQELMTKYNAYDMLGFDMSTLTVNDWTKINDLPKQADLFSRRIFGPNWQKRLKEIETLGPDVAHSQTGYSMGTNRFWKQLLDRATKIMKEWESLKGANLELFHKRWTEMTRKERYTWLRQCDPKLPDSPQSDIYAYIESTQGHRPTAASFQSPSLNLEDLSEGNKLPTFLEERMKSHPKKFRLDDGRPFLLGLWAGCIPPIRDRGLLIFDHTEADPITSLRKDQVQSCATQNFTDSIYGISFKHEGQKVFFPSNLTEESPGLGFFQLQAQSFIYKFLRKCTTLVPPPNFDPDSRLLSKSSQSDYSSRPDPINLKHLASIVKASLDEALDDFWQIRYDKDLLLYRLKETPEKPQGKARNLLRSVFNRIDTFYALDQLLDEASIMDDGFQTRYQAAELDGSDILRRMISLHGSFLATLEEKLCQLQTLRWVPKEPFSAAFCKLFTMLTENDATLRVMGLANVMETVDREIEKTKVSVQIPLRISQALSDLSVLAACLRETAKYYRFVFDMIKKHISFDNAIEEERPMGPWLKMVNKTLDSLDDITIRKLDVVLQDVHVDSEERHHTFWNFVDKQMETVSEGDESLKAVFDEIQQRAPVATRPLIPQDLNTDTLFNMGDITGPTETQMKKSKPRKYQRSEAPAEIVAPSPTNLPPTKDLPFIRPNKKSEQFWHDLQSSSSGRTFRWLDFCNAMKDIGCSERNHGGAARRFEWKSKEKSVAIVFHQPHGDWNKVTHSDARSLWLRRILKKFTLYLKEE